MAFARGCSCSYVAGYLVDMAFVDRLACPYDMMECFLAVVNFAFDLQACGET